MTRKQYLMILVLTLAGGLIGGVISNQFLPELPVFATESPPGQLETIGAEKFVVTDTEGNVRAVLGLIDDKPTLMMFGRTNSLPRILIFDSEYCRAEIALDPTGEASFNLFSDKGELRTAIGAVRIKASKTGEIRKLAPSLIFFDEQGQVVWSAPESVNE